MLVNLKDYNQSSQVRDRVGITGRYSLSTYVTVNSVLLTVKGGNYY